MSVQVYIPTPFRRATSNKAQVSVEAQNVGALLDGLEAQYAGLKGLVRNEQGEVHHHVNIYVNSEAIESLGGLSTTLKDGDEVSLIPALAGGQANLAWATVAEGQASPIECAAMVRPFPR